MWKDREVVWQQTNHAWDDFGTETSLSFDGDPAYAKVLATWKKQTLGEFVKKITVAFMAMNRFAADQNLVTSLALVLTTVNMFPLHLKLIREDEQAELFLSMMKEDDEGEQYFLRSDLEKVGDIKSLVDYFVDQGLLKQKNDQLIVQGRVLNRSHVKVK